MEISRMFKGCCVQCVPVRDRLLWYGSDNDDICCGERSLAWLVCTCVIMAALFSIFMVRSVLLTVRLVAMVKKHNDYNFCVMYDTPGYSQLLGFHKKYM